MNAAIEQGYATDTMIAAWAASQQPSQLSQELGLAMATLAMATAMEAVGTLELPEEFDSDFWGHAAQSRGSVLKVMLAYEYVRLHSTELYCGASVYRGQLRCIVIAHEPVLGAIALLIENVGSPESPSFGRPVTIIFRSRGANVYAVRISSCASFRILPLPLNYEPVFEPPPLGSGKCMVNH
jgi:hypothetical protein